MDPNDYNILSLAIKKNSVEVAKKILQKKDVCKGSQESYHLLVKALYSRRTEIARLLLKNGCKINSDSKTNIYDTPIHYALKAGDMELFNLLLSKGAIINNTDQSEETAIALAYRLNNHDAVQILLSNYFDESNLKVSIFMNHKIAVFVANLTKNHDIAKKIIKEGMDRQGRRQMALLSQRKTYNLHVAAEKEDIELAELLVLSKHDVNKKNSKGLTPLDIIFDLHTYYTNTNRCKRIINSMLKLVNVNKNYCGKNDITHFHMACAVNNEKVAKQFLEKGSADINQKISLDSQGHLKYFEKQSLKGFTPLHLATFFKSAAVIKLLLQHNVDIHLKDVQGFTPLQLAWKYFNQCVGAEKIKYQKIVELLLSAYCMNNSICWKKKGMTDFHIACTTSCVEAVEMFIKFGLNINEPILEDVDLNLSTPLHLAVQFNRLEVVKLLLNHKADVNATDHKTRTPLYIACKLFQKEASKRLFFYRDQCNYSKKLRITIGEEHELYNEFDWNQNFEIIRLLVEYGSDVNFHSMKEPLLFLFYSHYMRSPIERFMNKSLNKKGIIDCEIQGIQFCRFYINKRKEIIQFLVNHGYDVNLEDHSEESILHVLLNNYVKNDGSIQLVELFLSKGADPNATDCNDNPLLYRVADDHLPITKLLIKYKVNMNSSNSRERKTALHVACESYRSNLKLYLDNGANVNARNIYGRTPLHTACQYDISRHCRVLLEYGADVNVQDIKNDTFLSVFSETSGRKSAFSVIRNHIHKLTLLNNNKKTFITDKLQFELLTLENERISTNDKAAYLKRCEDEINVMKSTKIDNYSSLYDIIFKNSNEMAKYAKNQSFKSILHSDAFSEKFKLYGYLLELQFKEGTKREALLTPAKKAFNLLTVFQLPDLCTEQILHYLSNEELKCFLKVTKNLPVS